MNHRSVFHSRVEKDVREAVTRYEEMSHGLGERFKRSFYANVDGLRVFPEKHALKMGTAIRTRLMRSFPYLIFYVVEGDAVFILAVQYAGQKLAYLRTIVRERNPN